MKLKLLLFILLVVQACTGSNPTTLSLKAAGANSAELEKVLSHFKDDSVKLKGAYYIINNIRRHYSYDTSMLYKYRPALFAFDSLKKYRKSHLGYSLEEPLDSIWKIIKQDNQNVKFKGYADVKRISAAYLIKDMETSFFVRAHSPYKDSVSFNDFCDYVLPYRKQEGIAIEDWRSHFFKEHYQMLQKLYPAPVKVVIDSVLGRYLHYRNSFDFLKGFPYLKYEDFQISKRGECETKCWFNAMIFSSVGIPVAIDLVPAWGNRTGKHTWNVLINKGNIYPFEPFPEENKWKYKTLYNNLSSDKDFVEFRLPKVYRFSYASDPGLEKLNRELSREYIPEFFRTTKLKDVSKEYFSTVDVKVPLYSVPRDAEYTFLCVFNGGYWRAVQFGKIEDGYSEYKGLGRDIVYLPVYYKSGTIIPAANAFYVSKKGSLQSFKPLKDKISVKITRKYPIHPYKFGWVKALLGARIEGANKEDFSDAHTLYTIQKEPDFINQGYTIHTPGSFKYVRMVYQGEHNGELAELSFFKKQNGHYQKAEGWIISSNEKAMGDLKAAFDDDFNTCINAIDLKKKGSGKFPWWLGLSFDRPQKIDRIELCPRNDANSIFQGTGYELFYWDNKWVSLGRKLADSNSLSYEVPKGTFYLLKSLKGGKEERIFIIRNGQQVWL